MLTSSPFHSVRISDYEQPTEKGFVARMEYKSDGRLFRELKANCFDTDAILLECDATGVDVQVRFLCI